ncbi:hypothetical protein SAMN05660199_04152 [Klenkia soli]|uniref:Uncharacterized protein n=1 Tax=Klenkia soli TaxID=1052260 RepID=A0A1H0TG53_9ACTN|nr:hypothetical protein [Klenkia soli]SDP52954.1 hypothetical protein SAMN05660199_04152 [Klenkia soli]
MVFWAAVVGVVVVLLAISWRMDRAVRRRGSGVTHSGDISYQVREGRRDAEILGNPYNQDVSWSSWSRRNGRR